jgi:catechol 2,3-dioxygenase-like lactoylglutathione lyase family enzyme
MGLNDYRVEAAIAVSELQRARRFYEDQLGLVPGETEEPATHAGWFVDDLDATMDALTARGVSFERYDQPGIQTDERGVFDAGRFRAAWVKDPDGNTLAISQVST